MVSLLMKRAMYWTCPKKLRISFSVFGGAISEMALILEGSISIPPFLTTWPRSFPDVTPKVHFAGLSECIITFTKHNKSKNKLKSATRFRQKRSSLLNFEKRKRIFEISDRELERGEAQGET